MTNKKLLITGANGFVGSHLVEDALDNGFDVFAAVRKSSDLTFLDKEKVQLVYPDYGNVNALVTLLDKHGITHIAHVAGLTKGKNLTAYNNANAEITKVLAAAATKLRVPLQKFVFVSSLAVVGPANDGQPLTESTSCQPITFYGKSKLLAEQYLQAFTSLPVTILRPTAVYGPREKDMLILIKMVSRGFEFYLGRAAQRLSFIYVKDLTGAIITGLSPGHLGQIYHLSDGVNYDRYAFAAVAKQVLKTKTARLHLPVGVVRSVVSGLEKLRPGKMSIINRDKLQELTGNWPCSIEKAKNEWGYQPAYPLEKGIQATVQWNKKQKWL